MLSLFLTYSCREHCPRSVGVVDKINIFRPDRVFMVRLQCLMLYICIYIYTCMLSLDLFPLIFLTAFKYIAE